MLMHIKLLLSVCEAGQKQITHSGIRFYLFSGFLSLTNALLELWYTNVNTLQAGVGYCVHKGPLSTMVGASSSSKTIGAGRQ